MVDGSINLEDLFHGAPAGVAAYSLIANLSIEREALCGDDFYNFFPLGLPTAKLFALLGQELQRTRVEIEKWLILAPQGSKVQHRFEDFLDILIMLDESFCLVLDCL